MSVITIQHIVETLAGHLPVALAQNENRKACVMVTLVNKGNHLHLLLTKRADSVEHHKGQISFPGGMVDDEDESNTATALRELEEEIGISRSQITILGTLDDIHIPSGFIVTPVVGYINTLPKLRTNAAEVAEVLFVPFEKFFDPSLRRLEDRELKGVQRRVYFYDVWKEPVWGATAYIIKQLTDLLLSAEHH
ncbi:MAG: CoA pyrophosphatase [Bacteriovoracaceae bacterium]|nr:CoA pyrophosphatase [Bacteroidota bacterium]